MKAHQFECQCQSPLKFDEWDEDELIFICPNCGREERWLIFVCPTCNYLGMRSFAKDWYECPNCHMGWLKANSHE